MPSWDYLRGPAGARMFMDAGRRRGVSERQCIAGTGLTARALADPTTFVEAGQELGVVRNVVGRLGDVPGLGCEAAVGVTIGGLGVWGFAVLTSPTLAAAIDLGMRLVPLSTVLTRVERRADQQETAIVFNGEDLPGDVRDTIVERDLAALVPLFRGLLGELPPARLETKFVGARADAIGELLPATWRLVRGRPEDALVLSNGVLTMRMPQADPVTRAICERECEQLLQARRRRTGTAAAVRGQLLIGLAAGTTMDDVARALHRSTRSLRRHLEAEGTSFLAMRDEVRRELAGELLDNAGLSVGEVASRLGYADPTSFTRAFRRWAGSPPTRRSSGA